MGFKNWFYVLPVFFWSLALSHAQNGFQIDVKLEGFTQDSVFLAYYYGNKQYIKDTFYTAGNGEFILKGEEALPGGMYLVVLPPDNQYFQFIMDDANQRFTLATRAADPVETMQVEGSPENTLFYDYLKFLNKSREEAEKLKSQEGGQEEIARFEELNRKVEQRQQQIIAEYPHSFTSLIIKANQPLPQPEVTGTDEEKQTQLWRYTQKHFFDNINLGDSRLLRTPFLFDRVDQYVSKLQVQHPDTLSIAIEHVLEQMKPAPETFQFYLIHYLNEYASSKIVGQDAVYVHLAEKYYATGDASWVDEEQRAEIVENAEKLKPILVGKIAPDFRVQRRDGSKISLHEVESPFTVLYFWRYDCSHCQHSTPILKSFYESFSDRGVKFSPCV